MKGISIPRRGKAAPPCKCGKPRRIRGRHEERNKDGYFYAHNCDDCQCKYMLEYWYKRRNSKTQRGQAEKRALANSRRTLKILHRALTGVELAR